MYHDIKTKYIGIQETGKYNLIISLLCFKSKGYKSNLETYWVHNFFYLEGSRNWENVFLVK